MKDATPVAANCREGHTGALCHRCEAGYGRSGEDECEQCHKTFSLKSIAKFIVMVVVLCFFVCLMLIGMSFAIGEVYEMDVPEVMMTETPNPMLPSRASVYPNGINNPMHEPEPKLRTMLGDTNRPSSVDNTETEQAQHSTVSISVIMRTCKRLLVSGVAISVQPAKLIISYVQIVGHVGAVLHFQFPPIWSKVLSLFRPLVANIRGIVALECAGLTDFYQTWIVEVVMIPLTLLLFLCGWYLYRAKNEGATVALNKFFSEAFFLLYALRAILV